MRQKQVYNTSEVAHLWMHKAQAGARNKQGNFYFDGDTIYSYGGHFPIARHVESAAGKPAILFTTRGYSNTTSKHISLVRRAIPNSTLVFYVPDTYVTLAGVSRKLGQDVTRAYEKLSTARSKPQTALAYRALQSEVGKANEFNEWAGYKRHHELPKNAAEYETISREYEAALEVRRRERDARRMEQYRLARERREQESREWAAKVPELIEAWKRGENPHELSYSRLYDLPVMLRIVDGDGTNGGEIETSHGARFPVEHARRGVEFVRRIMATGQGYRRNGHTFHLGVYALDEVTPDGTVIAGCHRVAYAEVERIAALLGMAQ